MTPREHAAVARLIQVATGDTGQARRTADFLLAWWNAADLGGFNLIDAANVDQALGEDMITVFAFIARSSGAVYPDAYAADMKAVIRQWRPDIWARSQETTYLDRSPTRFSSEAQRVSSIPHPRRRLRPRLGRRLILNRR